MAHTCPKCGAELLDKAAYCGICGSPVGAGKVLCDGCMGAFRPGELTDRDGRQLCSLCHAREERRGAGIPAPGAHREMEFREFAERNVSPPLSLLAVASLLAALALPIAGLPGILLGSVALYRIRRRGTLSGEGFAVAAIVVGALTMVVTIVAGFGVFTMGVEYVANLDRQARVRTKLQSVRQAQLGHKNARGSWATREQLIASGFASEELFTEDEYKIDVFVTSSGVLITGVPRSGKGEHYLVDKTGRLHVEHDRPATDRSPVWSAAPSRRVIQQRPRAPSG